MCKWTQHCWMLHVVSICTPCGMLLGVVVRSLKQVKLLATCKQTQHWELLANNVASICTGLFAMTFKSGEKSGVQFHLI